MRATTQQTCLQFQPSFKPNHIKYAPGADVNGTGMIANMGLKLLYGDCRAKPSTTSIFLAPKTMLARNLSRHASIQAVSSRTLGLDLAARDSSVNGPKGAPASDYIMSPTSINCFVVATDNWDWLLYNIFIQQVEGLVLTELATQRVAVWLDMA
ncbi:hypothetical protein HW555_003384 [Spodoptera exigua]|uniref:Uncharacterized protein n=1 Tax=Spodoptera exigua TaxID=7107 RepID=A0A835GM22_SPOEX|nr:hypothetical protein HW555_003384 [Spodoptera exigua]